MINNTTSAYIHVTNLFGDISRVGLCLLLAACVMGVFVTGGMSSAMELSAATFTSATISPRRRATVAPTEFNSCFDDEYICRILGYTIEEFQRLRGLGNEAGADIQIPFPPPRIRKEDGKEFLSASDLFSWHKRYIDSLIARGTDAFLDIAGELKRTVAARNELVKELVDNCEFVETLVTHWMFEPECGCPPSSPRKTHWEAQKTHKNMPNLTSLDGVSTDFVAKAFGLSPEKFQMLSSIRDERAKAGINDPNPFPFSERGTDGKDYWEVSDFIGWHNKYVDALVAKGVSAFQDVVNELKTTASARNAVVMEMLVRTQHLKTLVERWRLEQQCDCGCQ